MSAQEDDYLDGMCDLDFDNGPHVTDEEAPYVALFATDLDCNECVTDPVHLEAHAREWHALFDWTRDA